MSGQVTITNANLEDVISLRSEILRAGYPREKCYYPNDWEPDVFHYGAFYRNDLVSIVTFYPEDYESKTNGWRLRGMATSSAMQGKGVGSQVLQACLDTVRARQASYIWCNARKKAINLYAKQGFDIVSHEFDIPNIGPHYVMQCDI